MHCFLCGRRLTRSAAKVETDGNVGHAGPTCARRAGLLPPRVARAQVAQRRKRAPAVDSRQMEMVA